MSYYDLSASDCSEFDDDGESDNEAFADRDFEFPTQRRLLSSHSEAKRGSAREATGDCKRGSRKTDDRYNERLWDRCILHLDVDCFYCQCEMVDGPPDYRERPLAIGQKHIIVTSNYIARSYGVKKLQSRVDARRACPNLLILEGSDLERYRKHSRNIYLVFREELKAIAHDLGVSVAVRKGGMDECFCDLTDVVRAYLSQKPGDQSLPSGAYVFGDHSSKVASIREDQSGAESKIELKGSHNEKSSFSNAHVRFGDKKQQSECQRRLNVAAQLAQRVRLSISRRTGFTTSMGISVSPMLSKLASDLKKPNSLNLLYPWRSVSVVPPMPLRKVPYLGRKILKTLWHKLEAFHGRSPPFWTCQDLLLLPQNEIKDCLFHVEAFSKQSDQLCETLVNKCRGIDDSRILDDEGGLTKTVSVEDSMRRGTCLTRALVWKYLEELFPRFARLLDERREASCDPHTAYPATVRLTTRSVDSRLQGQRRRPFVTSSKQVPFAGKEYMNADEQKRKSMLRKFVTPLIESLVFSNSSIPDINVTRINLAATGFRDLDQSGSPRLLNGIRVKTPFSQSQTPVSSLASKRNKRPLKNESIPPTPSLSSCGKKPRLVQAGNVAVNDIDPSVLAELPPSIAAELRRDVNRLSRQPVSSRPKGRIDFFFAPQK